MLSTPSPTRSVEGWINLIRNYHVSHSSRHEFTDFDSLKCFLEKKAAALINGSGPQYLAILDFTEYDLLKLESSGSRRELPGFKALLDEENKAAIIKLVPGAPHEVATGMFGEIFNIFVPTLSTRYHLSNELSKEPDASYKPRSRKGPDRFPSFVSLLQLRQDARLWLQNSNGDTKIVLLISLNIAAETLTLERWQNSASPPPRSTRSGIQFQLSGDPLILPINLLLDVVPSHVPSSEISIGRQELLSYCVDLFNGVL
ncbi:hypothetical protein V1509DRAFT_620379 [Lipomyces kononenkoae]